jgi:hypothetical protein
MFSDATLSGINVVLCYVLSQFLLLSFKIQLLKIFPKNRVATDKDRQGANMLVSMQIFLESKLF